MFVYKPIFLCIHCFESVLAPSGLLICLPVPNVVYGLLACINSKSQHFSGWICQGVNSTGRGGSCTRLWVFPLKHFWETVLSSISKLPKQIYQVCILQKWWNFDPCCPKDFHDGWWCRPSQAIQSIWHKILKLLGEERHEPVYLTLVFLFFIFLRWVHANSF